ncbi:hypothetical protein ACIQ6R_11840 [Streptomyces sp. NPDC096048]|uniref:hypothetical protein n=1 Tax=Streptomyces sp. NPDC096048 TaxID=3366072 RepID=UPI00381145BD
MPGQGARPGCRLASRCASATGLCATAPPPATDRDAGRDRLFACHHPAPADDACATAFPATTVGPGGHRRHRVRPQREVAVEAAPSGD